jgi:hypothetical protein
VNAAWRIELELGNKADLIEIGKAKHAATVGRPAKESLSQNDNDFLAPDDHEPDAPFTTVPPKHDTRKHIAKAAGVSTGQGGMAMEPGWQAGWASQKTLTQLSCVLFGRNSDTKSFHEERKKRAFRSLSLTE